MSQSRSSSETELLLREGQAQPLSLSLQATASSSRVMESTKSGRPGQTHQGSGQLDAAYLPAGKGFFKVGKVFKAVWTEPARENLPVLPRNGITSTVFGQKAHSKPRYFVVVREGTNYCVAVSINTYSSQGVGKRGVTKSEHVMVYTGQQWPEPLPRERPAQNEAGMMVPPIRVEPPDGSRRLDPLSRLHLGKLHTVEHYIRVMNYGEVHHESLVPLLYQLNTLWPEASLGTGVAAQ